MTHDHIIVLVFDSLRYDVAVNCMQKGQTPLLEQLIPYGWEKRYAPSRIPYAAHHAYLAGYFPTPTAPGDFPGLFETHANKQHQDSSSYRLEAPDIATGLAQKGYHTICIGGSPYFDRTMAGNRLTRYFMESHFQEVFKGTEPASAEHQFQHAVECISWVKLDQLFFLYMDISAIHPPNHFYLPHQKNDSLASHAAALEYVDRQLGLLYNAVRLRGSSFWILMSSHGALYEEDKSTERGYDIVWMVPYADVRLDGEKEHRHGLGKKIF